MQQRIRFDPVVMPASEAALRVEVRAFLAEALPSDYQPNSDFNTGESSDFSRKLGARGWIGMTWPAEYGGGEHSFLERYIVTEELVAAGAPVAAHWIADRQSGPLLLEFGTEEQRHEFLPRIARGECFFSIGMSEPDSGSDLASVRTAATRCDDGWVLNGTKIWTSGAHHNHYMIALVRTRPVDEGNRHAGMSQFIIDLQDPRVKMSPIYDMTGAHSFNQLFFDDLVVPAERMVGEEGAGWQQVMSELSFERSGPERFLSAFRVFVEFVREVGASPTEKQRELIGWLATHLVTLRQMSMSVASTLEAGGDPNIEAALVKDLGTNYEKRVPELVRLACSTPMDDRFLATLAECQLHSPSFTLRGGTREILRGVIARGLGLR